MPFDRDSYLNKLSKLQKEHNQRREEIEQNKDLSPAGKASQRKQLSAEMKQRHAEVKGQLKEATNTERDRLKRAAFQPLNTSEAGRAAYRSIFSEAASADQKGRRKLLNRYELSGDSVGKRAVLAAALEAGDHQLIEAIDDRDAREYLTFERQHGDLMSTGDKMIRNIEVSAAGLGE